MMGLMDCFGPQGGREEHEIIAAPFHVVLVPNQPVLVGLDAVYESCPHCSRTGEGLEFCFDELAIFALLGGDQLELVIVLLLIDHAFP
jgi:hypothetical protein